jgi:hypothetical protein
MDKKLETIIKEIVREPEIVMLNVKGIFDVINLGDKRINEFVQNKNEYRIAFASIPNTADNFTILDRHFRLSVGMMEIPVKYIDPKEVEKLARFDVWKHLIKENIVEYVDAYDAKEVLLLLRKHKISFRKIIDYLLDDTGKKDERIIDIIRSAIFPIPMYARKQLQQFNNNGFIYTNSGTGKSTTFLRILGYQPASDVTEAGLIGGISSSKNVMSGTLNGSGCEVIDEYPEVKEMPIINKLLSYTESGEATRELCDRIVCRGTKSIFVMGNCHNDDEYNMEKELTRIASGRTLERIGRRYCHVIFGLRYKVVPPSNYSAVVVERLRNIMRSVISLGEGRAVQSMFYCLKWVQEDDSDFNVYMKYLSTLAIYDNIRDYINGLALGFSKLKFAGVKVAVLNNLDALVLCDDDRKLKPIMKRILNEAKFQYEKFKEANIESFSFLKESPKSVCLRMMKDNKTKEEIVSSLNISERTYFRYRQAVLGEEKRAKK